MSRLHGIIPAAPTPLCNDGSLDLGRIPALVEHLLLDGANGLYVLGSTGEGVSLTNDERRRAAEAFVAAVGGRQPVVVQVGQTSIEEARLLAAHACRIGADAISATPPFYFRPGTTEALAQCMAEIAAGAEDLPFYYYHIPSVTGVSVDMPDFLVRAAELIPNLAGLKFTSYAVWEYQACLDLEAGRFDCLYGHDEMLLSALAVGARGAVGSTYNFALPLYRRIINLFEAGDLEGARRVQSQAVAMVRVLLRYGGLPAIKATMGLLGVDCGPVRRPLTPLSGHAREALRHDLEAIGFLDWSRREAAS